MGASTILSEQRHAFCVLADGQLTCRAIIPEDNADIADIIRQVMPEIGAEGPGTALHDSEVSDMAAAYTHPRSCYLIIEENDQIMGGGGIAPLVGGAADVCELKKMYFLPHLRGRGVGRFLLQQLLDEARTLDFRHVYIETMPHLTAAIKLYDANGFKPLDAPLGNTGHHACNRWYVKPLCDPI